MELIAAMGIPVRALLREKGTPYAELGLGDPKWSDEQLLDCEKAPNFDPTIRNNFKDLPRRSAFGPHAE